MKADVISFIKACPCCQKMSYIKIPINTSPFTTASHGLMLKLSMDCIGPLINSDGYTHILVVIDNFSRYVATYPIKGTTGQEIARCLLIHIGTFGCPNIIQMDNGPEFTNNLVTEVLQLLGTSGATILAYSKEENAIIERANREVMRHLRALIFELNKRVLWPQFLPLTQRIINSEVSSVIGVSPNDLLFGGKLETDGVLLQDIPISASREPLSQWSSEMLSTQKKLVAIAQKRQKEKDDAHIANSNKSITQYATNSFVLVSYPNTPMGQKPPTKLHTFWKGPMRVISNAGAEYKVHDIVRNHTISVHVSRLKTFEHDTARVDPLQIAAKDNEEDEVDSILDHVGDPKRKSSMDFLVKWTGYDDSENLWLPWSELRLNPKLHAYLREQNLEKLIPK